jgi:cell wall-associated NlpC family hydrolase
MIGTRRTARWLLACVSLLSIAQAAEAAPQTLDAKRREASKLTAQIEASGERLSAATEDFNAAQVQRARIDGKLARARHDLDGAEQQWGRLKHRLGQRVRFLYMHPGGWAIPYLEARSFNDFARGRIFAGAVLSTDTDVLLETERARADIVALQSELHSLRLEARSKEKVLAERRAAAEAALRSQRTLLAKVQGEIGQIIEAERRRKLEEAARRAASGTSGKSVGLPAPKNTGPVRPSASKAISVAAGQIGKPYQWGQSGPGSYDCSGLTMYSWGAAGVSLPHSSRAQYDALPKVANDQIQPGDLLFFGRPIHHVGLYEGGGVMINAPETGEVVRRDSIYRRDFAGAARP